MIMLFLSTGSQKYLKKVRCLYYQDYNELRVCQELENLSDVDENLFLKIKKLPCDLTCLVYGKQARDYEDLNEPRTNLYVKRKDLRSSPLTGDAFAQHVKQAILHTHI